MSGNNGTYVLSNVVAGRALGQVVLGNPQLKDEFRTLFAEGERLQRDPGRYTAEKPLERHPEMQGQVKEQLLGSMRQVLRSTTRALIDAEKVNP